LKIRIIDNIKIQERPGQWADVALHFNTTLIRDLRQN
jgi:hypothetical protein